jgi:hypothetical protein
MNVVDLWNFLIILNWLYGIDNWCHGFIIYMGHVHPIAQTHNSSMDVLHVSFRHDIFSYERRVSSATYGNAKWELGSQLNKNFPSPRFFFEHYLNFRLLEISSISKRKNVKCQILKYTYVILSFSQAVIFFEFTIFLLHVTMKVHSLCQTWLPKYYGKFQNVSQFKLGIQFDHFFSIHFHQF